MKSFNKKEMDAFAAYVKVQRAGRYNMFDPRARMATGLPTEQYIFVMENYTDLASQAESEAIGETA